MERLDVVIPIFNEEENLPELSRRLADALEKTNTHWRVVYVNDGSRDRSLELIRAQHAKDSRFCLVNLSRNFGFQSAILAGLASADGDAAIIMDGDLQDPPELIGEIVETWRAGHDVVIARRRSRKETGLRLLCFNAFHKIFRHLSDFPIPENTGTFGLMNRQARDEFVSLGEQHRFLPGLRAWVGFRQTFVTYDRDGRAAGEPKQGFIKLLRYAFDGIFSFSYKPLHLMTLSGIAVSALGFLLALLFIVKRLLGYEHAFTGFTTLITMVLFLGGIQLIGIGFLGEYIGRIYDEVKHRPVFIVRDTLGLKSDK